MRLSRKERSCKGRLSCTIRASNTDDLFHHVLAETVEASSFTKPCPVLGKMEVGLLETSNKCVLEGDGVIGISRDDGIRT